MLSNEMPTLESVSHALSTGQTTAQTLTEQALAKAESTEGAVVFTRLFKDQAIAQAKASDLLRQAGCVRSELDGIPISIKDLFDVHGYVTRAGSVVLASSEPATHDATIVSRLKQAGAIIIGTTNMTEFAYSGLGLNPHYGTPLSHWDKETGRISGGSSSGAAVSIVQGMAVASVGTDTGGSVRIPAAYCGLVGYKPTASRIDMAGTIPLSQSLDSIGPITTSVRSCAWLGDILAGEAIKPLQSAKLDGLRLGVPNQLVMNDLDDSVCHTFALACEALSQAGVEVLTIDLPEFDELASINAAGGFTAAESWAWHQSLMATHEKEYDPRVSSRIKRGQDLSARYLIDLKRQRMDWISRVTKKIEAFDALVMPTVPMIAPALAPLLADDDLYAKTNLLALRNPSVINFLDGCAVSLPCHAPGEAPVGLMLAAGNQCDATLLQIALAVEESLASTIRLHVPHD